MNMPSTIMTDDILDIIQDAQDSISSSVEFARQRLEEMDRLAVEEELLIEAHMNEHQMHQMPGFSF